MSTTASVGAVIFFLPGRRSHPVSRRIVSVPMIHGMVQNLEKANARLARNPRLLAGAALWQIAIVALDTLTLVALIDSLGARVEFAGAFVSLMIASLVKSMGFVPGGLGTFEETLEVLTWSQLGIHRKPIGLLNVEGYYDGLLAMIAHGVKETFIKAEYLALFVSAANPASLLDEMQAWRPPPVPGAWLNLQQT